jgi:hypothetical protein
MNDSGKIQSRFRNRHIFEDELPGEDLLFSLRLKI